MIYLKSSKKRRLTVINSSGLFRALFGLLIALFFVSSGGTFTAEALDGDYAKGRVLVKFKADPGRADVSRFAATHRLKLRRIIPRITVHGFDFADGRTVANVIEVLSTDPRVAYAEPDYIRFATYTPNDPFFGSQWDMTHIGVDSYWDFLIGSPYVVTAVLDTGIDLTHPDLVNQLWQNTGEIPGNNVDDDGNGYKDDYNGYDFAGNGPFPGPGAEDPIPNDDFVGHGTHVSGTVAAEQDNSIGITGEAPGTKLMAVRVLGGFLGSGYSSDIADGIVYATDNGAQVINMSLGGTGAGLTEYLALQHAWDNNVFIAAAAGNDGDSGNPISYPAAFLFAMSVGATDISDNIASFSTHNTFVEVSAPGVNILSTVPVGTYEGGWDGTSMATPHVAGLAALLYSTYGDMTNWQARSMIQSAAFDRGTAGWDQFFGYGRASAAQLIVTPRPTGDDLDILTPPDNGVFPRGSILSVLWNPVDGAVNYRITASLPTGGTAVLTTSDPYYTRPPASPTPTGSYTVTVEALSPTGATLASDIVSFIRQ
jgi:subtilisin family serine protease